jgi:hypothetical protein
MDMLEQTLSPDSDMEALEMIFFPILRLEDIEMIFIHAGVGDGFVIRVSVFPICFFHLSQFTHVHGFRAERRKREVMRRAS